ncbi:MAG: GIY-YIG nuclease family protein [Candidatus Bathyarchaeota archaeon]|nr:GIY-YIG nuclease family protein [Candidatus Bathyarchaeota archaeon]
MEGIYTLLIQVGRDVTLKIGALGEKTFVEGLYVYVGSAQRNLRQRVERHLRKEKRLFWHIDYLLNDECVEVVKVFYMRGDKAQECQVAKQIAQANESVLGFGCSDCSCKSHLFRVHNKISMPSMSGVIWHEADLAK